MIITTIFGLQRIYAQVQPHGTESLFDPVAMQGVALVILAVTIISLYVVTVFRNFVEDGAAAEMHSDTADFLEEWNK